MITLTSNDNKRVYLLNSSDVKLLVIIGLGARSCKDIADFLGVSKSAITQRIIKFEKAGLAYSQELYGIKHYSKEYILTKKGKSVMADIFHDRYVA